MLPRNLFVIVNIVFVQLLFGQNELKQLLRYGDELFEKGDYHYAKTYYERAMQIDSQTIAIQWKYAQILTAYQDYRGASKMYAKIYKKNGDGLYPECGLLFAKMLQQQGRYKEAIEILEKVIKAQGKNKKSERFLWATRYLESCKWAMNRQTDSSQYVIKNLPEPLNSMHSEFPHAFAQGQLYFSSLRTDSIKKSEEVYAKQYRSSLFKVDRVDYKNVNSVKDLNHALYHVGNGAFSLDSSRYYFSRCDDGKIPYTCKIYVASHSNGRFTRIDILGDVINAPGATTTQPAIAKINGEECLFFSSNREDGTGGMDIYYSLIKSGTQYSKPKNLTSINSMGNEITPFFHQETGILYFSSDFLVGYGGFDLFQSTLKKKDLEFNAPTNMGLLFNSPENDTYLLRNGEDFYLASNRMGSLYSKNPTCCSDIYQISPKKEETQLITFIDVVQNPGMKPMILPVLFFHNDIPNPRSRATTTTVDYITTYDAYLNLKQEYLTNWSLGKSDVKNAQEQIESFYANYVQQGAKELEIFRKWLLEQLQNGAQLELLIRGFASPLTSSDYNTNLTMRRIESLVNHLERFDNGIFLPYMNGTAANGGRLTFEKIPFGEYASNQVISDKNTDVQNSVYAPEAAMSRRIEVKAVRFLDDKDPNAAVRVSNAKLDFGIIAKQSEHEFEFTLISRSSQVLELDRIEIPSGCIQFEQSFTKIDPRESLQLKGKYKADSSSGPKLVPIDLYFKSGQKVTIYLGMDIA